jgi:hypothetical protein
VLLGWRGAVATTPAEVTTGDESPDAEVDDGGAGKRRPLYAARVTRDAN